MPWIAWLIAAAVLGVAEYFTLTLAFGLLAAAALVAAIVAGMGGTLLAQFLAFAIAGGVGLLIVRPIARRQMRAATRWSERRRWLSKRSPVPRDSSSSPVRCGRRARSMRTT